MVMDATQSQQPSPQSVGREFVRQYYTLLNKAPNHLHRFYNNNSSFIHGESTLVVGQKNIHNRIQQLNFHDCHAKISQVDAQATLGNGVVVQVTGELSNNGQPMRRFTQTFVLAAQSPKKYYVHNDIFRYQDVYSDEENDGESRSENDEEHEQSSGNEVLLSNEPQSSVVSEQQQQQQLPAQVVAANAGGVLPQQQQQTQAGAAQQPAIYYSVPPGAGARGGVALVATPQGTAAVQIGGQFATAAGATGGVHTQQVQATAAATVTQLNGVVAHEDLLVGMQQSNATVAQQQQPLVAQSGSPTVVPVVAGGAAVLAAQSPAVVAAVPVAAGVIPGFAAQSPIMQQQLLQQQQQQQPQHPLTNTSPQQAIIQSQSPQSVASSNVDIDDAISTNTVTLNTANETVSRNAGPPAAEPSFSAPPPIVDDFKTINEQQQQEKYEAAKQQQQQQNEPKTYANLFKSTSSSPSGFVNAAMQQQQQLQQQQQQQQQQQSSSNSYPMNSNISTATFSQTNSSSSISTYNSRSGDNQSSLRTENNNIGSTNTQGGPLPQRTTSRVNKDFEQRRPSNAQQFGDNQQLFLGNIPHHASEEDLKALFQRFGVVVELRILSKTGGSKLPPGVRNPLNYGFITYEDAESAQKCLAHCPLYYPENSPDRQKLNVEEKKPRMRTNDLPPRLNMGGGSNMSNNNMTNNQRNNMGGPQSRSLSNSGSGGGGMMRGGNATGGGGGSISRGGSGGGSRIGGGFTRNENRSGPTNGGGPQVRGGGNNNGQTGGGSYGGRR